MSALTLIATLALMGVGLSQEDFGFMPKGAKALLPAIAATADDVRAIAKAKRSEAEWQDFVSKRKADLAERDLNELTAYLSINMPVDEAPLPQSGDRAALIAALPQDGRELAWFQCQSCHSLFTGYLMQNRDVQGWRSIFLSPFHRNIKMSAAERETFARYSTGAMPMKAEDVPSDLRF
jgi:hypothetical protein